MKHVCYHKPARNLQQMAEQCIQDLVSIAVLEGNNRLNVTQCFNVDGRHFTMRIELQPPETCIVCRMKEELANDRS